MIAFPYVWNHSVRHFVGDWGRTGPFPKRSVKKGVGDFHKVSLMLMKWWGYFILGGVWHLSNYISHLWPLIGIISNFLDSICNYLKLYRVDILQRNYFKCSKCLIFYKYIYCVFCRLRFNYKLSEAVNWRCSAKMVLLKTLSKFAGKYLCQNLIFYLKRDSGTVVSMWSLQNFQDIFFIEHLW